MPRTKRVKRDIITDLYNPNKNYQVEAIINSYGDKIQPLWEQMRSEIETLGYKVHVETAISDGKLEVRYRIKP